MKFFIKSLILFAIVFVSAPLFAQTRVPSNQTSYTLSDGSTFQGTESEYKNAEFMVSLMDQMPTVLTNTWNQTVKKYNKFPTTEKILATAKFNGDAGYNATTGEYYVSNRNGTGEVVFEIKHPYNKVKMTKFLKEFTKNFEKEANKKEKALKLPKVGKVREDSDLESIVLRYVDATFDAGESLGKSMRQTWVDYSASTNKTGDIPFLVYVSVIKNQKVATSLWEPDDYAIAEGGRYDDLSYVEMDDALYKTAYLVFRLDETAPAGTVLTFKVNDVRQFSRLLPSDVWSELYQF